MKQRRWAAAGSRAIHPAALAPAQLRASASGDEIVERHASVLSSQQTAAATRKRDSPFLSLISTLTERWSENGARESSGLTLPPFPRTIGIVLRR